MNSFGNLIGKLLQKICPSSTKVAVQAEVIEKPPEQALDAADGFGWVPVWEEILQGDLAGWQARLEAAKGGPKVLIATTIGGNSMLTPLESLLGVALTLRGAEVHFLLCDKVLPACQNAVGDNLETQRDFLANGPSNCEWCIGAGDKTLLQLGLPVHRLSSLIDSSDRQFAATETAGLSIEQIETYWLDDIFLGEEVKASVLRFLARGDFEGEPHAAEIMQRYLRGGIISATALKKLFSEHRFDHTVINQGVYIPHGVSVAVAKSFSSHIVTWDVTYRQQCISLSHDDTYIKTVFEEPNDWQDLEWNETLDREITDYLTSRWSGKNDWLKVVEHGAADEPTRIAQELKLDLNKPVIGLLTNVVWDAQVSFPSNAFPDMLSWLKETVEYFASRPDLQLLIRIHPAEILSWVRSRQPAEAEIRKWLPNLPPNIFIVPPESSINTYKAMMNCDSVLIFATSAGLELACLGIPIVVAGEAWMRNKGISNDVTNRADYRKILGALPLGQRMTPEQIELAKKYAYHVYLRKMIPLGMLTPQPFENAQYSIDKVGIKGFEAGADVGLDVVCDGILKKSPFTVEKERFSGTTLLKPLAQGFPTFQERNL